MTGLQHSIRIRTLLSSACLFLLSLGQAPWNPAHAAPSLTYTFDYGGFGGGHGGVGTFSLNATPNAGDHITKASLSSFTWTLPQGLGAIVGTENVASFADFGIWDATDGLLGNDYYFAAGTISTSNGSSASAIAAQDFFEVQGDNIFGDQVFEQGLASYPLSAVTVPAAVPEPGTLALSATLGLFAMLGAMRDRFLIGMTRSTKD